MTVVNHIIKPSETLDISSGLGITVSGLDTNGSAVAEGRVIYMSNSDPIFKVKQTYSNGNYFLRVVEAYPAARFMKVRAFYGNVWHDSDIIPIGSVYKLSSTLTNKAIFRFYFFDANKNAITHPAIVTVLNQGGNISHYGALGSEPTVTPSGRVILRHPNNKGSIVCFTINDSIPRSLFVADAQYRNKSGLKWQNTATDIAGLYNHSTYYTGTYYIYNSGNVYTSGATTTANQSSVASLNPVTDKQLFERFGITYTNETASYNTRSMTDLITNSPAKDYVRGLASIMSGGLDLPTALDLCVLYVEGDNIDTLDPTLKSYAANALGKYTNSYRWLSGSYVWSCQEDSSSSALYMNCYGYLCRNFKTYAYAVLPVREV